MIREAKRSDTAAVCAVINDGASAYKGIIPADRWHEPYMPTGELEAEIAAGVAFWCYAEGGEILGVMGVQDKGPVVLIRHAYVRTAARRQGIGSELLSALLRQTDKPVLIGTWQAAQWAIDFYQKHGFRVLPTHQAHTLLERFWNVPARQIETSVVLADPRFMTEGAMSKTLFLVRHAKASRDDPELADEARPLNKRGKRDAAAMAQRLAHRPERPELIVTSPATRARSTAEAMAAALGLDLTSLVVDERIYDATAVDLLEVIRALDPRHERVMLVGHHPGITEIANRLAGAAIAKIPTCGIAEVRLHGRAWVEAREGQATLIGLDTP